jgi:hypothetical protein
MRLIKPFLRPLLQAGSGNDIDGQIEMSGSAMQVLAEISFGFCEDSLSSRFHREPSENAKSDGEGEYK